METPLMFLGCEFGNRIYCKRDDLYPFAFGGNKARIARCHFEEIDAGGYDSVVTYGSPGSNLCRAVASLAALRGLACVAVMHGDGEPSLLNCRLARMSGARQVFCPVDRVSETIDTELERLRREGRQPCFIPGGGRGIAGTRAYAACYDEIRDYERRTGTAFDLLFVPSGTGTTQSGLVAGQLLHGGGGKIVGISVARTAARGKEVIRQNVYDYCAAVSAEISETDVERSVIVEDSYNGGGYARGDYSDTASYIWRKYAVPLDNTYTAKAFAGMGKYLQDRRITGRNVLFLHTGATPLFFDDILRDPRGRREAPCGVPRE